MLDLGTVLPGSTIRIPFSTFDKDDGSSITMTNFAAADILIYKDGSTTERASTSGFTATTDFDSKTGKHLITIDLADNTTADFYAAGSEYIVALDSVTVDTVTVGGWLARFKIGVVGAILDTTIATLSSQTSFTLTAGPADNNALIGCTAVIHDAASAVQKAIGTVSAYTGSTKTVTLAADPGVFTMAAKDNISFLPPVNVKWWATGLIPAPNVAGVPKVDIDTIKTNAVVNGGTITFPTGATLASTTNITAGTITTTTNLTNLPTIPTNWLTADGLASDAVTEIQSGLATAAALSTVGGYIDTEVASIKAVTDAIGATGSGLSAIPWNAAWDAEVQSEVDDALVAQNLDHLVKIAVDTDFATTVHLDSVIGQLADNGTTATFDRTTDSQEAIRNRGDAAWITATGFATPTNITAATGIVLAGVTHTGAVIPTVSTVNGLANDVITAAATATDFGNEVADAILGRNIAGGSSTGRTIAQALAKLRNKWDIYDNGGTPTMRIYDTDDTTVLWEEALSTDVSTTDVITGANPA